jgi:hypothetical protein
MWQNGYLHAAVPTDLINDGRLKLNAQGKPELNGYVFDAVVFLNPEYATTATTKFFQDYVNHKGKLLLEGDCTHDVNGKDNSKIWNEIAGKASIKGYSLANLAKMGAPKNDLVDGVRNEEGAFTFTNTESLKNNTPATFNFQYAGQTFSGNYKGLASIKVDAKGKLVKLAATGFGSIQKNGKEILSLNNNADIFITVTNGIVNATVADPSKSTKIIFHD